MPVSLCRYVEGHRWVLGVKLSTFHKVRDLRICTHPFTTTFHELHCSNHRLDIYLLLQSLLLATNTRFANTHSFSVCVLKTFYLANVRKYAFTCLT